MNNSQEKKNFFVYIKEAISAFLGVGLMALYGFQTMIGWVNEEESFSEFMRGNFFGKNRSKYPENSSAKGRFYCWGLKNLVSRLAAFLWLREVNGLENIPDEGEYLIVPNHQSYLDFMLVIFALKKVKNLTFFVKTRYFDMPLWKFFLSPMGHIRADRKSISKAMRLLTDENLPVVLFAEGTRTKTGKIGDPYPGFGRIAQKVPNVKIIPVGIKGAFEVWSWDRRGPKLSGRKIDIRIGTALSFADFKGTEKAFSEKIMKEVAKLTE
ncbi:1-acyl-sn-glycerol-3-phosphate acyltransferase [bacterium]|jgi:1-acyl-sn-glycerol-3-phosphate acyltransferase|nr:1-acyl-sn-glycerol-3-phosphate acyltransferase [bacterium]MBT4250918.1 1-acyl-sn-glycerol-3-phosphate acyltransferase [bacterium]MBT4597894.1 1-acyl-sn-glycerol-3-phosphate acyltransferase [bacterium]MBT6753914.1 1-acyl-sn-glycerol-3-phosphate acyltransferase [bacterium]MBT7037343.1 1-acyl-sn-glycerol-3-phosphate acyltransferase [bacterium]